MKLYRINELLMAFYKASIYASDNVIKEINDFLLLLENNFCYTTAK
jgi:hypothetical protein